jgi:hypothetical protein
MPSARSHLALERAGPEHFGLKKRPVDYGNGLAGAVPLDDQKLIGNAPPPGEQLDSGFTSTGAEFPQSSTDLYPINRALTGFEKYRRKNKREHFLDKMGELVHWSHLLALVETHYPKAGPVAVRLAWR